MENENPVHIIWKRILKEAMDIPPEPPRIVLNLPTTSKKQAPAPLPHSLDHQKPENFTAYQKKRMSKIGRAHV